MTRAQTTDTSAPYRLFYYWPFSLSSDRPDCSISAFAP